MTHKSGGANLNKSITIIEPRKGKATCIDVIDSYYESINNQDEVDKIKFITDYQRLMEALVRLWRAHPL